MVKSSPGRTAPAADHAFFWDGTAPSGAPPPTRRRFLAASAVGTTAGLLSPAGCSGAPTVSEADYFAGATEWLNSRPLTSPGLRGRVILVDFCTYTCTNWLRTLPYVRAWAEKYTPRGLVLIGVHTPEFSFEKNRENYRRALKNMEVAYPVAIDSDYAIWRAFNNQYWPALYLVDAQGRIRYHKFGEGEYDRSETMIQRLLAESGAGGLGRELVSVDGRGIEAPADWGDLKSTETYVSYDQAENFASPGGMVLNQRHPYAVPARLYLNSWALSGEWTIGRKDISLNRANGRIAFCFHARDINLVMAPPAQKPSRFQVFLDGQPPGAAAGTDLDGAGNGLIAEPRVYQLIRQPKPIVDRVFEIEFLDPNAQAFVFTFG